MDDICLPYSEPSRKPERESVRGSMQKLTKARSHEENAVAGRQSTLEITDIGNMRHRDMNEPNLPHNDKSV